MVSLVVGGHGSAGSFGEKGLGFHSSLMIYGLSDANLGIMEGEWGRCVDHLQVRKQVKTDRGSSLSDAHSK